MMKLINTIILLFIIQSCFAQVNFDNYAKEIEILLEKMTLEEKVGQMTLYTSSWTKTGPSLRDSYLKDVKSGKCGNIFNAHTAKYTRELQRIAVEETRLGIPLLFGYDVIHGYKTIFPIPLAEACSWDLELIEKSARLASKEAAAGGLHWTFNPMVDIARDPRWGRISEGSGEDPYLGSLIAAAKVKGHQGQDLKNVNTLLACVKHFAAYGAAQAGRDYHTVDISERSLRETYLPPFQAAIDAGCTTIMTAFNELDGVPASASTHLLKDILIDEWDFKGLVVTDYTSINEMVDHGFAKDEKHAGELSANAGVHMDMQGAVFQNHLAASVNEGKVSIEVLNEAVRRILSLKYALGLFEDPFRYSDEEREKLTIASKEMQDHALDAARKSIVLLKNKLHNGNKILPLSKSLKQIAVIGPLADNQEDVLGSWHASGQISKVNTVKKGLEEAFPNTSINYAKGCDTHSENKNGFTDALALAKSVEVVVIVMGENYRQNGEAASRSELDLPGVQEELLKEIHKLGKPVILVLMAGRPLCIPWIDENIPAIVNASHLGTMSGAAIADVLTGNYNPSGKLVVSFPRNVGQIPIFYNMKNTGRPMSKEKYTSKYLDAPNSPLYPFGYGLSYSKFEYMNLSLSQSEILMGGQLEIKIEVKNNSEVPGKETVQLYVQDLFGSVTRPVKELKGFQQVVLKARETKEVTFELNADDLKFYTRNMDFKAEPGKFKIYVGGNSVEVLEASFTLK